MPKTDTPKDAPVGRRVYVQVTSPKTKASTSVALPFRFVGEVGTHVVSTPTGKRTVGFLVDPAAAAKGLVPVDLASFAAGQRQSLVLAARRHPGWVGVAEAPAEAPPKAKKGSVAAPKGGKRSKPAPKTPRAGKGPSGAPAKPRRARGKAPPAAPSAPGGSGTQSTLPDAPARQDGASGDAGEAHPEA